MLLGPGYAYAAMDVLCLRGHGSVRHSEEGVHAAVRQLWGCMSMQTWLEATGTGR